MGDRERSPLYLAGAAVVAALAMDVYGGAHYADVASNRLANVAPLASTLQEHGDAQAEGECARPGVVVEGAAHLGEVAALGQNQVGQPRLLLPREAPRHLLPRWPSRPSLSARAGSLS